MRVRVTVRVGLGGRLRLVDAVGGEDGLHAAGEQRGVEGAVGEQLAEVVDVEPLLLRLQAWSLAR